MKNYQSEKKEKKKKDPTFVISDKRSWRFRCMTVNNIFEYGFKFIISWLLLLRITNGGVWSYLVSR